MTTPSFVVTSEIPNFYQFYAEYVYVSKIGPNEGGRAFTDFGVQKLLGSRTEIDLEYGHAFTADRAAHLPAIRTALAPLRQFLLKSPFLGGAAPNYADYIALSGFYWAASAGTIPLMERDDSLRDYVSRGFDLYGGIAREPGIKPLFE